MGRLASVTADGVTNSYGYDRNGNALVQERSDGTITQQTFDSLNRMKTRVVRNSANAVLQSFEQGYDRSGTVRRIVEEYADASRNRTLDLTYDDVYRLTFEKVTNTATSAVVTTSYGYDAANNRTSKSVVGGAGVGTWNYTVNNLNQTTHVSGPVTDVQFVYDQTGSRRQRIEKPAGQAFPSQTFTYEYDAKNRLVSGAGPNGANPFAYTYDYRTRRIRRQEGGAATQVIFSGGLSRAEKAEGASDATVKFTRGKDLGGGVDGLLATTRVNGTRFIHSSSRGDVSLETDATGR